MSTRSTSDDSYSLRGRLLLWLLTPLMLIGLLALYDGYRAARDTADEVSDRVLAGSALAIAERVFVNDEGILEADIPYVALQMLTSSEDDRVFYRIEDGDGKFVTGYRKLELPENVSDSSDPLHFSNGEFRGDPIRIATYSSATSSNTTSLEFRVAIAETTNARNAVARDLLIRSALRQAALIFTAGLVVWFAIKRALRPLHRLESAVARRSPDDIRPIEHRVPREVRGLVNTINDLVLRFGSSIDALRRFTSNTSHQFRTPLALIKTHLEIADRESDATAKAEAINNANIAVGDAERLMAQMLLLARLDAASKETLSSETCNLSDIARDVCEDFVLQLSNSGQNDIDLGFHSDGDLLVLGEKTLVQEVIRNLIDNAVRHGGPNLEIDVHVQRRGESGVVSINDNGVGFKRPDKALPAVAKSGASTTTNADSGIGLTIVREILNLLSGQIEFGEGPGGRGTAAHVHLKLSQK
ncbi:MAG: HAMP domain-containing protein [Rhizobiaceae bacterium]|nr:HAMP domain-containing protein [Rhizobiaceae bacterium]